MGSPQTSELGATDARRVRRQRVTSMQRSCRARSRWSLPLQKSSASPSTSGSMTPRPAAGDSQRRSHRTKGWRRLVLSGHTHGTQIARAVLVPRAARRVRHAPLQRGSRSRRRFKESKDSFTSGPTHCDVPWRQEPACRPCGSDRVLLVGRGVYSPIANHFPILPPVPRRCLRGARRFRIGPRERFAIHVLADRRLLNG
jgi:hypothetical protein